jgi:hypothetical protein
LDPIFAELPQTMHLIIVGVIGVCSGQNNPDLMILPHVLHVIGSEGTGVCTEHLSVPFLAFLPHTEHFGAGGGGVLDSGFGFLAKQSEAAFAGVWVIPHSLQTVLRRSATHVWGYDFLTACKGQGMFKLHDLSGHL